jgi:hypothetical protein
MQQCNNCGEHVTERFARVFGDNDDEVFACTSCAVLRELYDGRASERSAPPGSEEADDYAHGGDARSPSASST